MWKPLWLRKRDAVNLLRSRQAKLHGLLMLKALQEYRHFSRMPGAEWKAMAQVAQAKRELRSAAKLAIPLVWPWRRFFDLTMRRLRERSK